MATLVTGIGELTTNVETDGDKCGTLILTSTGARSIASADTGVALATCWPN